MAPERKGQRNDEQAGGEYAPGNLARRDIGVGLDAADVGFIFMRFVVVRNDFDGNRWGIARRLKVVGYGLIFVKADAASISADKALVENSPR